jgi:hypothetical protein
MALIVAPRIPHFLSNQRGNFIILTTLIAKTFDDAFIRERTNYLVVHLRQRDMELSGYSDEVFGRDNGISIVTLGGDGRFTESSNRLLKYHHFADTFSIEEVLFPGREPSRQGNVIIPFYAGGYSDDAILHILVNGTDRFSVRLFKFKKEARILPDYAVFE